MLNAAGLECDGKAPVVRAIYRRGEINQCPSCSQTHWSVGRLSAECGFCGVVLPLADTGMTGTGLWRRPFPHAA